MKAYAVGALVSAVVLLPSPGAVASGEPSADPDRPPGWNLPESEVPATPGPGTGPDGELPPEPTLPPTPTPSAPPDETPAPPTPSGSPSPSGTASPSSSPSPSATPSERQPVHVEHTRVRRAEPAETWVPLPDPPQESFGSYDLYAEYADYAEPAGRAELTGRAAPAAPPILSVFSLGTGLASVGLGLAFLGLRLRRS